MTGTFYQPKRKKKQATKNKSSLRKIPKLKNTKQQKSILGAKHHLLKYRKTSFNQTDSMRNLVCKANQMRMGRRKKIPIPEKKVENIVTQPFLNNSVSKPTLNEYYEEPCEFVRIP